jgi:hypothetical protein
MLRLVSTVVSLPLLGCSIPPAWSTSSPAHRPGAPAALAPGLEYPAASLHEVPLSAGSHAPGEQTIFVDCDTGSDAQLGLSTTNALRTLPAAQLVARAARARVAQGDSVILQIYIESLTVIDYAAICLIIGI